jgi:hypothetical protein
MTRREAMRLSWLATRDRDREHLRTSFDATNVFAVHVRKLAQDQVKQAGEPAGAMI